MSNPQRFQNGGVVSQQNDLDPSAIWELRSPIDPKGFLITRMTTAQRESIPTPATSLIVFDTDVNDFAYYDGTEWVFGFMKFIPLAGTETEIPVTGDIEFQNGDILRIYSGNLVEDGQTRYLEFNDEGGVSIVNDNDNAGNVTSLVIAATSTQMSWASKTDAGYRTIELSQDGMVVSDTDTSKGLVYVADYSANFTARSLVDKEYVDDAISAATGDFVPLTGTEVGSPVTGVVEFNNGGDNHVYINENGWQIQNDPTGSDLSAQYGYIEAHDVDFDNYTRLNAFGLEYKNDLSPGNKTNVRFGLPTGIGTATVPDLGSANKTFAFQEDIEDAFVPITGTAVGNPVTGTVVFDNGDGTTVEIDDEQINATYANGNTVLNGDGIISYDTDGKLAGLSPQEGLQLGTNVDGNESYIRNSNATNSGQFYELPDKPAGTYTIATTEDVEDGFVPYSGATAGVDLNNQNLTNVGGISANGNITGDNLTGQNSGDESATTIGAIVVGATSKTTPVDADLIPISDSEASGIIKKLSFANLKTYLNTLYQSVLVSGTNIKTVNGNSLLGSGNVAVGDALVANRIDQNNAATTSAQLASVISDETGSGALVFAGSPDFTGAPTAPTAATGTNTTQLASTAFVQQEMAAATRQIVNDGTTYTLTGTTSETILYSKSLPANTFVSGKGWNLVLGFIRPTGTAQTVLRVYLNTSNAIGGVQIGTLTLINTNTWGKISRSYQIEGTTIKGFPPTTNNADDAMASSVAILSGTYNPAASGFLIVTAQPNNVGDSVSQIFAMAEK